MNCRSSDSQLTPDGKASETRPRTDYFSGPKPGAANILRGTLWESSAYTKNFHLPLPEQTTLAREAIGSWLRCQAWKARQDAIAAYAAEVVGTNLDLDHNLEWAGIEHLVRTGRVRQ
jgi:hypothetical protein